MITYLPIVTQKPKPIDLHAKITCVENFGGSLGYNPEDRRYITVHFSESEAQWRAHAMRIEIDGNSAEIGIDVLMSCIFTAYGDSLIRKGVSMWEHLVLRVKSYFLRVWQKVKK
jgi:hypothetical protein